MLVKVKDIGEHPGIPGVLSVTFDCPDPDGKYDTWRISFDPKNGEAPQTGMTIECEPKANKKGYWWLYEWSEAAPANGSAVHIVDALPTSVHKQIASSSVTPSQVSHKEAGMFAMGCVNRWVANQKDFPQQEELTGMIQNAKNAYLNGMK